MQMILRDWSWGKIYCRGPNILQRFALGSAEPGLDLHSGSQLEARVQAQIGNTLMPRTPDAGQNQGQICEVSWPQENPTQTQTRTHTIVTSSHVTMHRIMSRRGAAWRRSAARHVASSRVSASRRVTSRQVTSRHVPSCHVPSCHLTPEKSRQHVTAWTRAAKRI